MSDALVPRRLFRSNTSSYFGSATKEKHNDTADVLLSRFKRKHFLHKIVTGDETWVLYDNPKRRKTRIKNLFCVCFRQQLNQLTNKIEIKQHITSNRLILLLDDAKPHVAKPQIISFVFFC